MTRNLQSMFRSRVREMGGWCEIVESPSSACELLRKKYPIEKDRIVCGGRAAELLQGSELTGSELPQGSELHASELPGVTLDSIPPDDRRQLLTHAAVGITACDGLIAETGTVLLVNHLSEPRALSLLPESHVVIGTSGQVVESLGECLARLKDEYADATMPSITLVSGPSRTSDIEKTLIMGVHGPREFGVIILEQS